MRVTPRALSSIVAAAPGRPRSAVCGVHREPPRPIGSPRSTERNDPPATDEPFAVPSAETRYELRTAYRAALFLAERLEDADVRTLALYASYQSAMALGPALEVGGDVLLYARDEIRRSHDAAHQAILDYLDDLMSGNA